MDRRQFQHSSLISFIMLAAWTRSAHAISLNDLSGADASSGLKAALEKARSQPWAYWAQPTDLWATTWFALLCQGI